MINRSILQSRVEDKFKNLTFHCIVNECFVKGLPIAREEVDKSEEMALTKYSYKALEQLGGFTVLENALASVHTPKQTDFLANLYLICTEAASTAAKRVVAETDTKNTKETVDEIVDKASFTDKEYTDFVTKADKMDLDKVSEIIKDKTLDVIKDEREQYEKEEELDNELKDALSETSDFSDMSVESYLDIVIGKDSPRHHVTLFSKLQDNAMEMMAITPVGNFGLDALPIVDRVTFEAFLPEFHITKTDFDLAYENYVKAANEEVCEVSKEDKPKLAMLVSTIIYTLMETLKTMNLYCPSQAVVRNYVEKPVRGEKIAMDNSSNVVESANALITELNGVDLTKLNSKILSDRVNQLKCASEAMEAAMQKDNLTKIMSVNTLTDTYGNVSDMIANITGVLEERRLAMANESHTLSYSDRLKRGADIAQFDKIHYMYSKNPLVSEIRLKVNPSLPSSVVDVECANESGTVVKYSFMNIQTAVEGSMYTGYLEEIFGKSELANTGKNVCIVYTDGTGKKIPLNC